MSRDWNSMSWTERVEHDRRRDQATAERTEAVWCWYREVSKGVTGYALMKLDTERDKRLNAALAAQ